MVEEATDPVVAVVDDDGPARIALGRLLRAAGFDTALFDSAEAFIASPPPRRPLCLVVDVDLGGMSGIDLQRHLHQTGSAPPIIVITGHREDAIRARALREGCIAFLWKPFDTDALLAAIGSAARHPLNCTKVQ
jgi:FixJ family two-component response regulator